MSIQFAPTFSRFATNKANSVFAVADIDRMEALHHIVKDYNASPVGQWLQKHNIGEFDISDEETDSIAFQLNKHLRYTPAKGLNALHLGLELGEHYGTLLKFQSGGAFDRYIQMKAADTLKAQALLAMAKADMSGDPEAGIGNTKKMTEYIDQVKEAIDTKKEGQSFRNFFRTYKN